MGAHIWVHTWAHVGVHIWIHMGAHVGAHVGVHIWAHIWVYHIINIIGAHHIILNKWPITIILHVYTSSKLTLTGFYITYYDI